MYKHHVSCRNVLHLSGDFITANDMVQAQSCWNIYMEFNLDLIILQSHTLWVSWEQIKLILFSMLYVVLGKVHKVMCLCHYADIEAA